MVLRQDRHIQVTAFVDRLPARLRLAVIVWGDLLMLGFAATVLVQSLRLAGMVWTVPTAAMEVPWTLVYLGIVSGMAAMVLVLVGSLWRRLTTRREHA